MKIIKAPANRKSPFIFFYVLRNIYYLGGRNIDISVFDLKIERNDDSNSPGFDENGIPYIQLFGLDLDNPENTGVPDGLVDSHDISLFLMNKGLLRFPLSFPTPFNAGEAAHALNAEIQDFEWEDTYLQNQQAPQLYDANFLPQEYPNYGFFRIVTQIGTLENP